MDRSFASLLALALSAASPSLALGSGDDVGAGIGPVVQVAPLPRVYPTGPSGNSRNDVGGPLWTVGGRLFLYRSPGMRLGGEGEGGVGDGWTVGYGGLMSEYLAPLGPFDAVAGGGLGFGGLGLDPGVQRQSVKFFYLQPRVGLLLPIGGISAELHLFIMLPLTLEETIDGSPASSGRFYGFAGAGFALHLQSDGHDRR